MSDRFPHDATIAGNVRPENLTEKEREDIASGILGYCAGHRLLYKKWCLSQCVVPAIFEDKPRSDCREWNNAVRP